MSKFYLLAIGGTGCHALAAFLRFCLLSPGAMAEPDRILAIDSHGDWDKKSEDTFAPGGNRTPLSRRLRSLAGRLGWDARLEWVPPLPERLALMRLGQALVPGEGPSQNVKRANALLEAIVPFRPEQITQAGGAGKPMLDPLEVDLGLGLGALPAAGGLATRLALEDQSELGGLKNVLANWVIEPAVKAVLQDVSTRVNLVILSGLTGGTGGGVTPELTKRLPGLLRDEIGRNRSKASASEVANALGRLAIHVLAAGDIMRSEQGATIDASNDQRSRNHHATEQYLESIVTKAEGSVRVTYTPFLPGRYTPIAIGGNAPPAGAVMAHPVHCLMALAAARAGKLEANAGTLNLVATQVNRLNADDVQADGEKKTPYALGRGQLFASFWQPLARVRAGERFLLSLLGSPDGGRSGIERALNRWEMAPTRFVPQYLLVQFEAYRRFTSASVVEFQRRLRDEVGALLARTHAREEDRLDLAMAMVLLEGGAGDANALNDTMTEEERRDLAEQVGNFYLKLKEGPATEDPNTLISRGQGSAPEDALARHLAWVWVRSLARLAG